MERTMSVEDKIRRAEEIYYRRNHMVEEPIKKTKKSKMIRKIIICLLIYTSCYIIINNNYIFSEDFTQRVRKILSQDINFSQICSFIMEKIKPIEPNANERETKTETEVEQIQNNDENIGGAEELPTNEQPIVENIQPEDVAGDIELTQMEQDANYIKNTISFIKPVEGTISSMFGLRNPTTASVPKNHTGTDIAAKSGTKIVSATQGEVVYKSSKGDYGNHIKIQVNDVIILYAHCKKIYVKQGDIIQQGQEIAEVGSTGNTTGPHLHFEIRYQDRYVDPQLVVEL